MSNSDSKSRRRAKTSRVHIRVFEKDILQFRNVKIEALRVVKEFSVEERGDPLDALIKVVEKLVIAGEGFFEARVEGTPIEIIGEIPEKNNETSKHLLSSYPLRLKRIGVVRYSDLSALEGGINAYTSSLEKVRWYRPRGEYYVFEGEIETPEDVYLLIIETEKDRRIIRIPREDVIPETRFSAKRKSSEPQP